MAGAASVRRGSGAGVRTVRFAGGLGDDDGRRDELAVVRGVPGAGEARAGLTLSGWGRTIGVVSPVLVFVLVVVACFPRAI